MSPPLPDPKPRRRKRRRPEPAQYARTDEGRVRVWEWSACGEPLSWPHVSPSQPPCMNLPVDDDDEDSIPFHPAEV